MLCGLLTPDEGRGTCLGLDIRTQTARIKRQVGYMTQRFSLYEDLSIAENLDFIARVYGMDRRHLRVADAIERLGLTTRRGQLAGTLSGGWKQRVALAACLLHDPKLLLLDEPTAGVDPSARRGFWEHLHELAAAGMTVLVSTHYMDEAERCHELAFIFRGELLASGTPREILDRRALSISLIEVEPGKTLQAAGLIKALPGVEEVNHFGLVTRVASRNLEHPEQAIRSTLLGAGVAITSFTASKPNVEDAFVSMVREDVAFAAAKREQERTASSRPASNASPS